MKTRIVTLLVAAVCTLTPACSQTNDPEPTTTVTVSSSTSNAPASAPPPPASPTPGAPATTAPGADGSTGNELSPAYCAQNEDPGCPTGSYIGPDAIPNPNGDGSYVPCEGTICTNPDHGAGPDPTDSGDAPPEADQGTDTP
ncbi:hypothetical protein BH11ACT6_BH11ACT6_21440 [soil metagenome]